MIWLQLGFTRHRAPLVTASCRWGCECRYLAFPASKEAGLEIGAGSNNLECWPQTTQAWKRVSPPCLPLSASSCSPSVLDTKGFSTWSWLTKTENCFFYFFNSDPITLEISQQFPGTEHNSSGNFQWKGNYIQVVSDNVIYKRRSNIPQRLTIDKVQTDDSVTSLRIYWAARGVSSDRFSFVFPNDQSRVKAHRVLCPGTHCFHSHFTGQSMSVTTPASCRWKHVIFLYVLQTGQEL